MTGREAFGAARANPAFLLRGWPLFVAAVVALAAVLGSSWDVASQTPSQGSPLVAADPEPNALLAAPPDRITLTFAEPIDLTTTSIRVLRAGGGEAPLGPVQLDDPGFTRVSAWPEGTLAAGNYTVVWFARTAEGESLAGAYPFRTGVVANPGAAQLEGEWPTPWASALRWLVFLGTSLAAGGFAWVRLLAPGTGSSAPGNPIRGGVMAIAALVALVSTALPVFLTRLLTPADGPSQTLTESLRAMPLGWWIQLIALFALALICLGVLASGRPVARLPAALDWVGVGSGLAALAGLSLTSHAAAASPFDAGALALEIAHQWSTALWLSGLLYLAAGWRGLGSDVAHFRRVRWIGGLLLAISVVTGVAGAWPRFPSLGDLLGSRYGQLLGAKGIVVLVILALGLLAMVVPRHSTAARASRSLGSQGIFALLTLFLAAVLALMAAPGTIAPASLAGVDLADVVPVDSVAFAADSATIHLLTQPVSPGAQTMVVRLTDERGNALALDPPPEVEVVWTPFTAAAGDEPAVESAVLTVQPDPSSALFTGAVTLPTPGWWQADAIVTPVGGVASRARFWLVLPDPNVTGRGPRPVTDAEARVLYERGLASLTSLHSVRYTQRLGDGGGSLYRSQTAVSAAAGEQPAAYTDTVIDTAGRVVAQQTIVGDRRWIRVGEDWAAAEPISFLTPAAWGEAYLDATGFQLGPREAVAGELSQVVTFWQPPRTNPSRAPAWFAWWIGLASGEVRREAMVSTRHYMVYEYGDFDAPPGITPPIADATPDGALATPIATPVASPAARDQIATP